VTGCRAVQLDGFAGSDCELGRFATAPPCGSELAPKQANAFAKKAACAASVAQRVNDNLEALAALQNEG
jgi:hypothetical protein